MPQGTVREHVAQIHRSISQGRHHRLEEVGLPRGGALLRLGIVKVQYRLDGVEGRLRRLQLRARAKARRLT